MKGGRYFMQKKEQMQSLRHRVFKEHQGGQCDRSIVSKEESGRFEITEEKGEGVGPRLW